MVNNPCKAPFIRGKPVLGRGRVTLQAESTLARIYTRNMLTPLPEPTALGACSDCLAFIKLTRLGELKCLYGEKLARLGG